MYYSKGQEVVMESQCNTFEAMNTVFLLLGSNEGDRLTWLQTAVRAIRRFAVIDKISSVYETAAWGLEDQPDFLNAVAAVATSLSPEELLRQIQEIEREAGRQRTEKWGQRTLDIDILFFNNEVINRSDLKIPHPFLQDRRFTLEPLHEIAADLIHPVWKQTIAALLSACTDELPAKKLENMAV